MRRVTSTAIEAVGQPLDVWGVLKRQLRTDVRLTWQPARTPIVAFYSEKGGVGKSAGVAGVTATAAKNDLTVLAIDLDPRRTLTEELDAVPAEDELTVNDILWADENADPSTRPLRGVAKQVMRRAGEAWGPNVWVIPAERDLSHRESDNTTPNLEMRLALSLMRSLDGVDPLEGIDLVVIDVPPRAGGRLVRAGLNAATDVLYPATLDEDGFIGVRDARTSVAHVVDSDTRDNRVLRELGVLRNIVESRTQHSELHDRKLRKEFGDLVLDVVVPKRSIRQESRTARVPITVANTAPARAVIGGYTGVLNIIGSAA